MSKKSGTKLGEALKRYTNPTNKDYDAKFTAEIRTLKPHWFVDKAAKNKEDLLELAKAGGPKPG